MTLYKLCSVILSKTFPNFTNTRNYGSHFETVENCHIIRKCIQPLTYEYIYERAKRKVSMRSSSWYSWYEDRLDMNECVYIYACIHASRAQYSRDPPWPCSGSSCCQTAGFLKHTLSFRGNDFKPEPITACSLRAAHICNQSAPRGGVSSEFLFLVSLLYNGGGGGALTAQECGS